MCGRGGWCTASPINTWFTTVERGTYVARVFRAAFHDADHTLVLAFWMWASSEENARQVRIIRRIQLRSRIPQRDPPVKVQALRGRGGEAGERAERDERGLHFLCAE